MVTQPQKTDPRIVRTRQALRQALLELISEHGYQNITVKAIAKRAGLNRTTFYLHFQNKEDLLNSEFSILWDRLQAAFPLPHQGGEFEELTANFQQLEEFGPIYKAMLGKRGAPVFKHQLVEYLLNRVENKGNDQGPEAITEYFTQNGILVYLAAAYLGLLEWWLENNCQYSPAQMADLLIRIYNHSPVEMLGWFSELEQPAFPD
jgi:AcrR family transcriptional regulator